MAIKRDRRGEHLRRKARDPELFLRKGREATERHRKNHPESYRRYYVGRIFKTTLEEFDSKVNDLLKMQGATCWVCGRSGKRQGQFARNEKGRRIVVDHDHKTGKLRGLLCDLCNTALGKLGDDPKQVLALYQYIRQTEGDK